MAWLTTRLFFKPSCTNPRLAYYGIYAGVQPPPVQIVPIEIPNPQNLGITAEFQTWTDTGNRPKVKWMFTSSVPVLTANSKFSSQVSGDKLNFYSWTTGYPPSLAIGNYRVIEVETYVDDGNGGLWVPAYRWEARVGGEVDIAWDMPYEPQYSSVESPPDLNLTVQVARDEFDTEIRLDENGGYVTGDSNGGTTTIYPWGVDWANLNIPGDDDEFDGNRFRIVASIGSIKETVYTFPFPVAGDWGWLCDCRPECLQIKDNDGSLICLCPDDNLEDHKQDMERIKAELLKQLPPIIITLLLSSRIGELQDALFEKDSFKEKVITPLLEDEEFMGALTDKIVSLWSTDDPQKEDEPSDKMFSALMSLLERRKDSFAQTFGLVTKKEFDQYKEEQATIQGDKDQNILTRFEDWSRGLAGGKVYRFRVKLSKGQNDPDYKPIEAVHPEKYENQDNGGEITTVLFFAARDKGYQAVISTSVTEQTDVAVKLRFNYA